MEVNAGSAGDRRGPTCLLHHQTAMHRWDACLKTGHHDLAGRLNVDRLDPDDSTC